LVDERDITSGLEDIKHNNHAVKGENDVHVLEYSHDSADPSTSENNVFAVKFLEFELGELGENRAKSWLAGGHDEIHN
jgi:hypothetical protein